MAMLSGTSLLLAGPQQLRLAFANPSNRVFNSPARQHCTAAKQSKRGDPEPKLPRYSGQSRRSIEACRAAGPFHFGGGGEGPKQHEPDDLVPATVAEVGPLTFQGVHELKLRLALEPESNLERMLVLYIGALDAGHISSFMKGIAPREDEQRTAFDFHAQMMRQSESKVTKVAVVGLNPVTNIYIARIHWSGPANSPLIGKGHPKERVMETRPSQAIGLALHFDAPIFVSRSLVREMKQHVDTFSDIYRKCQDTASHVPDPTMVLQCQMQMAAQREAYGLASRYQQAVDAVLKSTSHNQLLSLKVAMMSALTDRRFEEAQQLEFQLRQAVVAHREKQKEADQRFYERRDAQSGESNQEDSVYQAAQEALQLEEQLRQAITLHRKVQQEVDMRFNRTNVKSGESTSQEDGTLRATQVPLEESSQEDSTLREAQAPREESDQEDGTFRKA
mmetsp:Transcript_3162/g.9120  ORF Transcript_3162/g.9120 Transcript_3162/m.9120 type:complete len:448 (+) Transcript_3162:110-1453(+)